MKAAILLVALTVADHLCIEIREAYVRGEIDVSEMERQLELALHGGIPTTAKGGLYPGPERWVKR